MSELQLQRLLDRAAIEQLKARYFRCVDLKLWEELGSVFTADAELQVAEQHWNGRTGIVELMRSWLDGVRTVHHGHMPEIDFQDADHATGVWAMFDLAEKPGESLRIGFGHYHDSYVRDGGDWRIASLRLERLRIDHLPPR